ncbi:glycopeptide antibiotics resistance protein [Neobacillus drentensis]|nr:glycopeptide antibiotics resistance protein [Neobacillus drentensis]
MRIGYLIGIILTILFGLSSRKFSQLLPVFLAENAGDVLWAMMVYFGFRFLLVRKSFPTAITLSLLFSYGIEFSQLYQAIWINHLRSTLLGSLILGKGFLAVDLFRYAAGIIFATILDQMMLMYTHRK